MTDIRQALEEAFKTIYGAPDRSNGFDYWKPELVAKRLRFNQLIQAEAWTDAAMMLIPGEDWGYQIMPQFCVLRHPKDRSGDVEAHGAYGLHPAHALLAACLKAKEQADG